MGNVNLNDLTDERIGVEYTGEIYFGKVIKSKINDREYFHLVFKSENKGKLCIKTIFLREENLEYQKPRVLISKKDFCPVWIHPREKSDKEYFELEERLK